MCIVSSQFVHANEIQDKFNLSIAFYNDGLYENALSELEQIEQRISQPFAALYNNKGLVYERLFQPEKAERSYLKALSIDPKHYDSMNNLGYLYAESDKNLFQAISLCSRAAASDPNNFNYIDSLGWAYFKAGMFNRAIDIFLDIIKRDPDYYPTYYKLGLAYEKRKLFFKAIEYFNTVNRICISENNYGRLYFLSNIAYLRILNIREEFKRMELRYNDLMQKMILIKKIDPDIERMFKNIFETYRSIALVQIGLEFFNQEHKNKMSASNFDFDTIKKQGYYQRLAPDIEISPDLLITKTNIIKSEKYGYNPFVDYIESLKELRRSEFETICFQNMRTLYTAYLLYNMEHEQSLKFLDIEKLVAEGYLAERPVCPFGGDYSLYNGKIRCSIHGNLGE